MKQFAGQLKSLNKEFEEKLKEDERIKKEILDFDEEKQKI